MNTLLILHKCKVTSEKPVRLLNIHDLASQQVPERRYLSQSPPSSTGAVGLFICSSIIVWLGLPYWAPSHKALLNVSLSADQSIWAYLETIKLPMFKVLKLQQWKPLLHLTGLSFWSAWFGGLFSLPLRCFLWHSLLVLTKEDACFCASPKCHTKPLLVIFKDVC